MVGPGVEVGETTPLSGSASRAARGRARDPRRTFSLWVAALLVTLVAFAGTVTALNLTVYSASGFASRYLAALDRADVATLMELPGMAIPEGADTTALARSGIASVDEARVAGTRTRADGVTEVEIAWRNGDETGSTSIALERDGRIWGLFSGWRFAASPVEAVSVRIEHASSIRVNDTRVEADPTEGASSTVLVAAFVPTSLTLDLDDRFLRADPVTVVAGGAGTSATASVVATEQFASTVQSELDAFLDECALQEVLFPAGCPFGRFVEDRLAGPPSWSIVAYPEVTIVPGERIGEWRVPASAGTAHFTAEVISLFDGSRSTLDEDVEFTVDYLIRLGASGTLEVVGAAS